MYGVRFYVLYNSVQSGQQDGSLINYLNAVLNGPLVKIEKIPSYSGSQSSGPLVTVSEQYRKIF